MSKNSNRVYDEDDAFCQYGDDFEYGLGSSTDEFVDSYMKKNFAGDDYPRQSNWD